LIRDSAVIKPITGNIVIDKMLATDGVELTRKEYLNFAYLGDPPAKIDGELEAELRGFEDAVRELLGMDEEREDVTRSEFGPKPRS
jgi:hypothetical protein